MHEDLHMMYERDYIKRPILYWSFFVVQIPRQARDDREGGYTQG